MATDKEIIDLLLGALEGVFIERTMLLTMIMTYRKAFPQIGNWEKDFESLRQTHGADVRKRFAKLREAAARSKNLELALEQFLKDFPPKGPVQ